MAGIVPLRVNDTWVRITGELVDPRYVFVVDKVGRNLVSDLSAAGVNPRDQVVTFSSGSFKNINNFLQMKRQEYNKTEAFVFLWIGQEEISEEAPANVSETIEKYFHPNGPRVIPLHDVNGVASSYMDLVRESLNFFPNARIFSTDAVPRRSSGFCITRANYVSKKVIQQSERHHHFALNKHFHGRRSGACIDELGGRFPIHEWKFEDGVFPTTDAWAAVLRRSYAAISSVMGKEQNDPDLSASLKLVNIRY